MPVSCCSITCVTVCSTVSALAPGYVVETVICGGAISGYAAVGSSNTQSRPATVIRMAITHAKTGRSMKKSAMRGYCEVEGLVGRAEPPGAPSALSADEVAAVTFTIVPGRALPKFDTM